MKQEQIIKIEKILTEARFQFAIKCLYRFVLIEPKNDIAFSSHSIYEGLLMVYFLSSGAIEERLKHILYLTDVVKYELIQYYSLKRDSEQSENNASAASTDYDAERRCWIKNINFNPLIPLKNIFNDGFKVFHVIDTPMEKIHSINLEIQNAVKNHISCAVKIGMGNLTWNNYDIKDDMELVLKTVLRFNVQKFQISTTCQSEASNNLNLLGKRKNNSFFYYELNMHVSEFPYNNGNTSLFLFVPASVISGDWMNDMDPNVENICDLIERLTTEEGISKLRNLLDSDTTQEDITNFTINPIFCLERDMPMRALLRDLGIEELLRFEAINLDRLFVNNREIVHLGNAVHRICVNVTEENTVACAVNVIYTGQENSEGSKRTVPNSNFPYVWLIYDKLRRNVLFAGAFNKCSS